MCALRVVQWKLWLSILCFMVVSVRFARSVIHFAARGVPPKLVYLLFVSVYRWPVPTDIGAIYGDSLLVWRWWHSDVLHHLLRGKWSLHVWPSKLLQVSVYQLKLSVFYVQMTTAQGVLWNLHCKAVWSWRATECEGFQGVDLLHVCL